MKLHRPVAFALVLVVMLAGGCNAGGGGGPAVAPPETPFCGASTEDPCPTDADCVVGGCSGQICQGADREPVASPCEWKECYDSSRYGLACGCDAGACRWRGGGEGTTQ